MSVINKLVDKITSGPQAQYILGGALVVIIALSLASVFWSSFRGPENNVPTEWHAYCLETNKEFVVDSKNPMPTDPTGGAPGAGPNGGPGFGTGPGGLILSPYTNKYTAVIMTHCPNPECDKWFLPDYLKDALERKDKTPMMMMMPPPDMKSALVCPYCTIDIYQWYREHRKTK